MEQLLELADLQRVRRGLWQEPVIPEGGQGTGTAHYPGAEVALTMNTLGSRPCHPMMAAAHAAGPASGHVTRHVVTRVMQRLDEDGRGHVSGVVLGPRADVVKEGRDGVQGQQPGGAPHHGLGGGAQKVGWRVGVV